MACPTIYPTAQNRGGKVFVIEGDEYDSTFFDKRSKFIHYRPQIAILNNLEFDHADIFRDLEDVQLPFFTSFGSYPLNFALVNGDDPISPRSYRRRGPK